MSDQHDSVAMAIAQAILTHPETAAMGAEERAAAAHALAINLGGVLATSLGQENEEEYRDSLVVIMEVVDRQARATRAASLEFRRETFGREH